MIALVEDSPGRITLLLSGARLIIMSEDPYCSWIGETRPDGNTPSRSDLQAILFARCRATAPGLVLKMLDRHVDTLDLSLPALPRLNLDFPRWLLGDLVESAAGTLPLDPIQLQADYQARLARRIAAATPTIKSDLDRAYAARTWHAVPSKAPKPTAAPNSARSLPASLANTAAPPRRAGLPHWSRP